MKEADLGTTSMEPCEIKTTSIGKTVVNSLVVNKKVFEFSHMNFGFYNSADFQQV